MIYGIPAGLILLAFFWWLAEREDRIHDRLDALTPPPSGREGEVTDADL